MDLIDSQGSLTTFFTTQLFFSHFNWMDFDSSNPLITSDQRKLNSHVNINSTKNGEG